ncbi:alpha-N-arabinofuranosidase [Mucilaginibacter yixingensis]|uniref:non-reducing end alpha-L-arabinofuranosidase n=1 Tax=Mucilaginibacter yixingensis TaxID=1295612 RepID=A0A2T5J7X1_9SPHI|nr:alpha-L-arabinofuranosidase C-terminal domain-containing protein [Mucilaginibacter yixingensis]PTQ95522.1 alpha-N-arabinofuranosidase [Mucilaginibacter yixingensis]
MRKPIFFTLLACALTGWVNVQAQTPALTLQLDKPGAAVSPTFYGLMTEEINHSYDGGLYAELIRNRVFKDNADKPEGWSTVQDAGGKGNIMLIGANEHNVPADQGRNAINDALTTCLKLTVETAGRVGIANEGFWGIPVKPSTAYRASFYAKCDDNAAGPLTVSLESNDGKTVFASGKVTIEKGYWQKYQLTLNTAAGIKPTKDARFVITTDRTGTYFFNLVSLFPPTFNNRTNGNRPDLMQMMGAMKPSFLRLPGGNFLEGDYFTTRFPWKTTLGPLEERPGHPGCWSYRASDGMGLLEFLEWCEDLKIEPVLAVYAGYSLKGDFVPPGPLLKPYIDEALEEIEYVTGGANTVWGARRIKDGHPAPFKLQFVEIGNEDGFDRAKSYSQRFDQFAAAIRAKYPQLKLISTVGGKDGLGSRIPAPTSRYDLVDEHYYRTAWQMEENADQYDSYDRNGAKIFVGEWATREGAPTTNMNAALGDAAWMTGMERNADLIKMSCYAPLFVNVNEKTEELPRAWQWGSDLIGYDALNSYGSPSYHAQKMFSNNLGNQVVPVVATNIPTKKAGKQDSTNVRSLPKKAIIPTLFYAVTKDTKTGSIFIKVVNTASTAQAVDIAINGAAKIASSGTITTLKGDHPEDTNTIKDPEKIVPASANITGLGKNFNRVFAPYSITVIQLKAQ